MIFHPQLESFETQIAAYLGAKTIISPDNSALHLAAFVGHSAQHIAVLLRRVQGAVDLLPQLSAFCECEPLIINAISQIWVQEGRAPANWGQYAELSSEKIYTTLLDHGFITTEHPWRHIGPWLIKKDLAMLHSKHGGAFTASNQTG